ncbi:histone-lysine N-methyltransferase SETMAR-like [Glossina fuscipes]|uniref:Histone-lysine N-methyltransferase SETMAR-like n=1 Tax=Glossina fuscipes TaxID=7396 RepID=A0A9C5ZFJ3_9MUSC|nr:histone-lysine N-methyltransferase SETMAR-like [Glossina fuscipes]
MDYAFSQQRKNSVHSKFEFSTCENARTAAKILNGAYDPDTVTANSEQFRFRRFRSGIFDGKDARRTRTPIAENVDEIVEMIKVDRHVTSHGNGQELAIGHDKVLSRWHKAGFKKKLDPWVRHQITQKNIMDRISIYKALAKRNQIDPFLKQILGEDEKRVI